MEVAKIELDNRVVNYKFSQPSPFDFRETNWYTFYTCGFCGRNYKKKVKFCKNVNVCLNISQLIQTFGNEKMNMLNVAEIVDDSQKKTILTPKSLIKLYFPNIDNEILLEYFSNTGTYYLYYFENKFLNWFVDQLQKKN